MRVLFVTPELTPYSGVTPAGDACWALPKALKGLGHEVTVLTPLYGFVDPAAHSLARRLRKIEVRGPETLAFEVYDARTSAGVDLLFLGQESLFAPCDEPPLDDDGDPANGRRFAAFAHAAAAFAAQAETPYDVVHGHDWPTALVPTVLRAAGPAVPAVQTFHDLAQHGRFEAGTVPGLPEGRPSFLAAAFADADRVSTISPTYARAVAASLPEPPSGELSGILGGVDVAVWNPATDPHLESRFDAVDRAGKRRSKAALQHELGLPVRDDVPLLAALGPFDAERGLDTLARIAPRLLRNDVQVALVTPDGEANDPHLLAVLEEHQVRWPDRFQVRPAGSASLVHRLVGSADALFAPRVPPGSSLAMRAHRYGTLPVGPREAAFADSVVDCDADLRSGTGFLFDGSSDEALLGALQRVVTGFAQHAAFAAVRARAMRVDHSWERAAYHYERLYRSARSAS